MKEVLIYVDSSNPFNSIYLQTKLLADAIERSLGINPRFISRKELSIHCGSRDCIILIPFGSFNSDLLSRKNFSNVVLIYHNITPAKYFWTTEPLVAFKSLLGRLQLRLLKNTIKAVVSVSPYNQIELERMGYNNVLQCPNILIRHDSNICEKSSNPSVLYVGRIVQNKDCLKLLEVVINVSKSFSGNLDFFIVGDGKKHSVYYYKFKQLIKKAQLINNINIYWVNNISQEELISLYQKSWLYITMSKHEGFGLPVCESINNGTPAIYTQCGGQEAVLNNVGLVQNEQICSEIEKLITDGSRREQLYLQQRDIINKYMEPDIDSVVREVYGNLII